MACCRFRRRVRRLARPSTTVKWALFATFPGVEAISAEALIPCAVGGGGRYSASSGSLRRVITGSVRRNGSSITPLPTGDGRCPGLSITRS